MTEKRRECAENSISIREYTRKTQQMQQTSGELLLKEHDFAVFSRYTSADLAAHGLPIPAVTLTESDHLFPRIDVTRAYVLDCPRDDLQGRAPPTLNVHHDRPPCERFP